MAGAEKIVDKIMEDARAEAEEIRRQAREEADSVAQKASREAEQEKERILKEGRARAEERRRYLVTSAQMDGRRQILGAKEELIDEVLEQARRELAELPDDQYARTLEELVLADAPAGQAELILSPRDRERLGQEFADRVNGELARQGQDARLTLAGETRPLDGGFVLLQGGVELNYSFAALLKARREELESEVARVLFAGEPASDADSDSHPGPEAGGAL